MPKGRIVQQTVITLISDISGDEASETVTFGLDGVAYEIDLTEAEAAGLREAVQPFAGSARRIAGRRITGQRAARGGQGTSAAERAAGREERAAIRDWANSNGLPAPDRGRIPEATVEAYRASH